MYEVKYVYWDADEIYIYFYNNRIRFLCIFPIPIFSDKKTEKSEFSDYNPAFLAQE